MVGSSSIVLLLFFAAGLLDATAVAARGAYFVPHARRVRACAHRKVVVVCRRSLLCIAARRAGAVAAAVGRGPEEVRGVGLQAGQLQLRHGADHPSRVRGGGRAAEGLRARHARVSAGGVLQGPAVSGRESEFGCSEAWNLRWLCCCSLLCTGEMDGVG